MNLQTTADRLAVLARLRLVSLLRLSTARHIYDPTPGALHSRSLEEGATFTLDKWKRHQERYKDLARFTAEDRVVQSIVVPGLLPIAKAISKDVLGRRILITRKIAPQETDRGVSANLDGVGIRILLYTDAATSETIVAWECLYGVV